MRSGFKFEALHTCTDRDATPLYRRIRAKQPATGKQWIRPMKLTSKGYELREPEKPANGKPLDRLHELGSGPDDVVILTDGEHKADQLAALGPLVTTSGAADSAGEAHWQTLAGRDVLIWRDNGKSGRHCADAILAALRPLGCRVKVIDVDHQKAPVWVCSPLCPSRTPKRCGNHKGPGTPLPFCAEVVHLRRRHAAWHRWRFAVASRSIGLGHFPRLGVRLVAPRLTSPAGSGQGRSRCTVCGFDRR